MKSVNHPENDGHEDDFHELCGASEADDANGDAPLHAANQRFSKKVENLEHAVSLHFMHYNFAWIHKTLRVTPAMGAGVGDHVWILEEIAVLAD